MLASMSSQCNHAWLVPLDNRTTCKKCGCDGWIYIDAEANHLINKLQFEVKALRFEIEMLRRYGNKDCTAQCDEFLIAYYELAANDG